MTTKNKSVTFILPCIFNKPAGGPKVIYEYSNRLAKDGWNVSIAYLYPKPSFNRKNKLIPLKQSIIRWKHLHIGGASCRKWFELDKRVREIFISTYSHHLLPIADLYVATGVDTAILVDSIPIDISRKFYIIQGFENLWGRTTEDVVRTYHYSLNKFVVSHWLKKILDLYDCESCYLPNGFDFDYFKLTNPIKNRDKLTISMLYHNLESKGTKECFEALNIVKERYSGLKVKMFGAYHIREKLPDWITYTQSPTRDQHNKILNESSIFINASHIEGWGLTIGEAMQCGCAVACTNNDGFKEMVIDGKTGVLSPIKDPKKLADNIINLIENDHFRIQLATNGNINIKKFTWDKSYSTLKEHFESALNTTGNTLK